MIQITAITTSAHDPDGPWIARTHVPLKVLTFPGGEVHVTLESGAGELNNERNNARDNEHDDARQKTNPAAHYLELKADLRAASDILALLMTTDALRRLYPGKPIDLVLPYVPYARQDRVANPGEALGIKVFASLVNAQGYRQVVIQDPHSDVTPALIERIVIDDPDPAFARLFDVLRAKHGAFALVAPDAGARKRVLKIAAKFDLPVVFADKTRDTRTGAITGTAIQGDLPDCPLVVLDDICDGGRTFTELAQALAEKRGNSAVRHPLYLFVTHGIFSKGLDALLAHYASIFTRNNWTQDARAITL